jgi:6-phosphogluconate dehydrogenase
MQLGLIGLGKMGASMAERLRRAGHEVVGYDLDPARRDVASILEMVETLDPRRAVWIMLPPGESTRSTVRYLGDLLTPGDIVVDGGNSKFTDDKLHSAALGARGIHYVDVGVSGGIWGLENGYGLMVGGSDDDVARLMPAFQALKPTGDGGFVHAGKVGAGHFAKMVHNGIEYGIMQAYAEGYELLAATDLVANVDATLRSWRQGAVIRSWLLDLLCRALAEDPGLEKIKGVADDSGEGRWTVEAAIDHAVPMPTISSALFARFASRQEDSRAMKVVAALRNQFGGHSVMSAEVNARPRG